jgi:hypothetical protein
VSRQPARRAHAVCRPHSWPSRSAPDRCMEEARRLREQAAALRQVWARRSSSSARFGCDAGNAVLYEELDTPAEAAPTGVVQTSMR